MNTSAQPRSCPELLGLRTVLGAVHADDAIHFMAMWQDPSFAKDAGIEATNNLHSLRQSLERFALLNASGLFYKWSIRLRDQATFVGEIEAYPLKPQTSPWIEWGVGYSLMRSFWGRGLMRESLLCVLTHLFSENLAQRVRADVGLDNLRSQSLLRSLNFRLEGLQESKNLIDGQAVDMQLWAMSRQRFLNQTNREC
ncbi:MAG: N-acetyltransferase [Betaproteobacteria bacterium]|nr:N-acetyltransferase [Betaproteobacteria bacterium]NCX72110.1 N-acetyltransferase [Betaproteobacteria bacterium]NDF76578.1 N-acetyltransferase [Betaproteobacteria bacterium]NDH56840.1 N-acetyltransferase [Betaproteobacteria bacterium]